MSAQGEQMKEAAVNKQCLSQCRQVAFEAVFDPLDGSRNIDAGIPTGTIFGIYRATGEIGPLETLFHAPSAGQVYLHCHSCLWCKFDINVSLGACAWLHEMLM